MKDPKLIAGVIAALFAFIGYFIARNKNKKQDDQVTDLLLKSFVKEKKDEIQAKSLSDAIREFNDLTDDGTDPLHNRKSKGS